MRENVVILGVSLGLLSLYFYHLVKRNSCYKCFNEIGVDVDELWRKMLCFRVSIGLLPLILIVSWNETLLWRFKRNQSWCWWDMKENIVILGQCIGLLHPYFDCLIKWHPIMKVWKKSGLMLNEIWRKMLCCRVSIGFLSFILIIS